MKVIDMPRGTGKTYHLAKISHERGIPIITENAVAARVIYKDIFPNAKFITYTEYQRRKGAFTQVLIDEFPQLLQNKFFSGAAIIAMTYSSENLDCGWGAEKFLELEKKPCLNHSYKEDEEPLKKKRNKLAEFQVHVTLVQPKEL